MTDAKKLSAWELARQLNEVSRQLAELERPLERGRRMVAAGRLVDMDAAELVADGARRLVGVLDCIAAAGTTAELESLTGSRSGTWAQTHAPAAWEQREGRAGGVFAPDGHELASGAGDAAGDASAGFDRALGEGRR